MVDHTGYVQADHPSPMWKEYPTTDLRILRELEHIRRLLEEIREELRKGRIDG